MKSWRVRSLDCQKLLDKYVYTGLQNLLCLQSLLCCYSTFLLVNKVILALVVTFDDVPCLAIVLSGIIIGRLVTEIPLLYLKIPNVCPKGYMSVFGLPHIAPTSPGKTAQATARRSSQAVALAFRRASPSSNDSHGAAVPRD